MTYAPVLTHTLRIGAAALVVALTATITSACAAAPSAADACTTLLAAIDDANERQSAAMLVAGEDPEAAATQLDDLASGLREAGAAVVGSPLEGHAAGAAKAARTFTDQLTHQLRGSEAGDAASLETAGKNVAAALAAIVTECEGTK